MAAIHLFPSAQTSLKGWFTPTQFSAIRGEAITSIKVDLKPNCFVLIVSYSGEKQEFNFATLESLNEALSALHLTLTDLDEKKN